MKQQNGLNWEKNWRGIYFAIFVLGAFPPIALTIMGLLDTASPTGNMGLLCALPATITYGFAGFLARVITHRCQVFVGQVPPTCPGMVDENTVFDGLGKVDFTEIGHWLKNSTDK